MPDTLSQGLVIVLVGMGGVFFNLLVLMVVVMIIGRIFGKKPKKKTDTAKPRAEAKGDADAPKVGSPTT